MEKVKSKAKEIHVPLNDRLLKGLMRMDSEIPTRILFILWDKDVVGPIFRLRIRKSGSFVYHEAFQYLSYEESQAVLYKLYRFAEKHMEI